ncbi:MAG: hypothetical protein Q9219_003361 [cf. Caloplaca sp. 3 TL-2023]
MRLFLPLILAFGVATAQAELICLGWGLINPIVGLVCHFKPDAFHKAQNKAQDASVAAVEAAAQSVKHLVQFDLTHNPAYITYNFLSQTRQGGIDQGLQALHNSTRDIAEVTVGFSKETGNQVIKIFEVAYWHDISFCLIRGASQLAKETATGRKRAGVPAAADAAKMAQGCLSEKLKVLAAPPTFNVTGQLPVAGSQVYQLTSCYLGSNNEVGKTISDIASLLVPVGAEADVAAKGAGGAVDLAVPGLEETTLVTKLVDDDIAAAQHFANEDEAQAVAKSMRDEKWVKENCRVCGPPSPPNLGTSRKNKQRSVSRLHRRGNILSCCCPTTKTVSAAAADYDGAFDVASSSNDEPLDDPIYDSQDYNEIGESQLVDAPAYRPWDVNNPSELVRLQKDLDQLSTGVVTWSPELLQLTNSEEIFAIVRKAFTAPDTDPLYQALEIKKREGGTLGWTTLSDRWLSKPNPALKPLQDFVTVAVKQGKQIVAKLKHMDEEDLSDLRGNIEFFYTPPAEVARTSTDPRGFHVDYGLMQFGAADTPGLIVRNVATKTASRCAVPGNTWQVMKSLSWDTDAFVGGTENSPTWHSVFGPEMAEKGRVSLVMDIFPSDGF